MRAISFNYESAALILQRVLGVNPEKVSIYSILESVSSSGMSRVIKLLCIKDNQPVVLGVGRVKGGGMDMGFHAAETVFARAYPNLDYREHLEHRWI